MTPGIRPPPAVPSEGLDLAALYRADGAVRDAAAAARAGAIAERLAAAIASVEPATAALVTRLIEEIGRVDARAAAAEQAAAEMRRNRGEWVALDSLLEDALAGVRHPPGPVPRAEIGVAEAAFQGFGWHEPEGAPGEEFRWSRHTPASVVLPSVGAGIVAVRLSLLAPFGLPIRAEDITVLHDGMPLLFSLSSEGADHAELATEITSADEYGLTPIALVLSGPRFRDPSQQEIRSLGLGLRRAVAERL